MLGIKVKSTVKSHFFTPREPAPAAEKNPRGNTGYPVSRVEGLLHRKLCLLVKIWNQINVKKLQNGITYLGSRLWTM